jgi:pre-mRNA-splicing factor ATP-dependent RNA helicase DHX15/PRP43
VLKLVRGSQTGVLIGETGSGKTTQVPQFLLADGLAVNGGIAVTQPRRVAAMSVAARVAQEADVELGEQVGYLIRFEDVTSERTKIKYMTDGMLLRECMTDPMLSKYSVVVLDEAHERTLSTDILFGLLKEVLQKRPELKCLVMSATLEAEKFQEYWSDAPLLRIPGRMFAVETFFSLRPQKDYVEAAIDVVCNIHQQEGVGDILVFLCGEEEIVNACSEIEARADCSAKPLLVLPLYSSLPMPEQRKVFPPAPEGVRKVIVSTNISETSVTIDGVVYVVDPGLFKQKLYNPRTHAESLLVSPISKASAMQRSGRAGRTRPGKCFRLYTPETFDSELAESNYPEIIRSNLCSVVLTLKTLGVEDLVHFDFMEPPSPESMMRALEMLHFLQAVDDECELTQAGRQMAMLPIDPHLSRAVIAAAHSGCLQEALAVVAMLSVPSPFQRPRQWQKMADRAHQYFANGTGDHLSFYKTYSEYCLAASKADFCRDSFLQERGMRQAESVCKQLKGICRNQAKLEGLSDAQPKGSLMENLRKSLCEGFFMQCAHIEAGGKHYMTVRDQQMAYIHPSSFLTHKPEWVLYHETMVTDRLYMRTVTAITPEMLIEVSPKFYHPKHSKLSKDAVRSLERALPRLKTTKTGKVDKR